MFLLMLLPIWFFWLVYLHTIKFPLFVWLGSVHALFYWGTKRGIFSKWRILSSDLTDALFKIKHFTRHLSSNNVHENISKFWLAESSEVKKTHVVQKKETQWNFNNFCN